MAETDITPSPPAEDYGLDEMISSTPTPIMPGVQVPAGKVAILVDEKDYRRGLVETQKRGRRIRKKPKADPISYERILGLIRATPDLRKKFFVACAYLTGGRVSELLQLNRNSFETEIQNGEEFLCCTIITLKEQRDNPFRKLHIPKHGYESELVGLFEGWLSAYLPEERLFAFTRNVAWRVLREIDIGPVQVVDRSSGSYVIDFRQHFPCFPHYMRHCRISHLKTKYRFDDQMLMKWTGWTTPAMAANYVHLLDEDITTYLASKVREKRGDTPPTTSSPTAVEHTPPSGVPP